MMSISATRDLNVATVREVACGWLQKEERLFWHCVVQLADVLDKVAPDGDDLDRVGWQRVQQESGAQTFLPFCTKDAMMIHRGEGVFWVGWLGSRRLKYEQTVTSINAHISAVNQAKIPHC